jgi:TM2 domain-containing membrane protein YozV
MSDEHVRPQFDQASVTPTSAGPPAVYHMAQATLPVLPQQVAPKNPGLALVTSFFFPGLGTLMNGQAGKGIGIFVGYAISWVLCLVLIGFIGVFGFWVWGMVDAYQGAKKWNSAHGILS